MGITQEKAEELAKEKGFPLGVAKTSFKANSKALAEKEGEGEHCKLHNVISLD